MNFTSPLDSVLSQHLQAATVFRGASNTIQNELLDIVLKTMQCRGRSEKFIMYLTFKFNFESLWGVAPKVKFGHTQYLKFCPPPPKKNPTSHHCLPSKLLPHIKGLLMLQIFPFDHLRLLVLSIFSLDQYNNKYISLNILYPSMSMK